MSFAGSDLQICVVAKDCKPTFSFKRMRGEKTQKPACHCGPGWLAQ